MEAKKSEKANLQRNSMLYFLIGINVVLLVVYLAFNYKQYGHEPIVEEEIAEVEIDPEAFIIEIPEPETPPPPPKADEPPPPPPPQVPETIIETPEPVTPPPIKSQEPSPPDLPVATPSSGPPVKVDLGNLKKATNEGPKEERVTEPVTVARVSEMAVYPGCESDRGNKKKLIACFSKNLQGDILRYLDTEFPDVDKGAVAVMLEFHIGTDGYITNIEPTRGDDVFKPEAKRALEKAADYLRRKGRIIEPAKLSNGQKVPLIFSVPVKLTNPNY